VKFCADLDGVKNSKPLEKITVEQPDHFWTPAELVTFSAEHQKAVAKPGKKFHYSDTGYILLGLLVEKITGQTFEENLHAKIFNPTGMENTYMLFRSKPAKPQSIPYATVYLGKTNVSEFKSLSVDWAGGGVISTTKDLISFSRALQSGQIISQQSLESMKGRKKFMGGIFYGLGLMTLDFGDMLFLMMGTPIAHGHSGVLGTHVFYSPELDAHIAMSFGSSDDVGKSFEYMYYLLTSLKKIQKEQNNRGR